MFYGGRGGIRTHEGLAPLAVFKTAALNHSATLPTFQLTTEISSSDSRILKWSPDWSPTLRQPCPSLK
jgi:hypothetical protein